MANVDCSVVRASLGAMSTVKEVDAFIKFLHEAFIGKQEAVSSVPSLEKGPEAVYSSV